MSDAPNKIFACMQAAAEARRTILSGGAGDYRFLPDDLLKDAAGTAKEAGAVLDEVLNKKDINLADFWVSFKIANGLCAMTRDQLAVGTERVAGIVGHLNSIAVDLDAGRLASRIPGYVPGNGG